MKSKKATNSYFKITVLAEFNTPYNGFDRGFILEGTSDSAEKVSQYAEILSTKLDTKKKYDGDAMDDVRMDTIASENELLNGTFWRYPEKGTFKIVEITTSEVRNIEKFS